MHPTVLRIVLLIAVCLCLAWPVAASEADPGEFGGVGLQVVPTVEGDLVVLQVVEGAPADRQGLQPGDLIFQVDDFRLKGSEFGLVVAEHLWGPVDSKVTLHYLRPGVAGSHQVVLLRTRLDPKLTVTPTAQPASREDPLKID